MPGVNRQQRWSRLLWKAFDLKGTAPDLQVLDDVLPVAPLYDPTDVEHHYGRDEILWSRGFVISAGGAATYNTVQCKPRDGYITVIEAATAHSDGARAFGWKVTLNGSLAAAANAYPITLDCRFENVEPPGAQFYFYAAGAALTVVSGYGVLSATAPVMIPIGCVLDSDDLFEIQNMAANTALYLTLYGYDRRAEASERG